MYRQAQACSEMKEYDNAKNILTKALEIDAENKGTKTSLDSILLLTTKIFYYLICFHMVFSEFSSEKF